MVGALRQQAINERAVRSIRLEDGVGNSLRRILVEVETGGPEGEVEIDDDAVELEIARDRPSYIMCDRRCADAAFRTPNGDDSADCYGFRSGEQAADRPHHVEGADGPDDVVVDTTAHQLAIRRLIVLAADNDNACPRIAHGRQFVEARENVA